MSVRDGTTCTRMIVELPDTTGIYMPDDDRAAIAETLSKLKPNEGTSRITARRI